MSELEDNTSNDAPSLSIWEESQRHDTSRDQLPVNMDCTMRTTRSSTGLVALSAPREPETEKGAKDPAKSSMNDMNNLNDEGRKNKSRGKGPKKSAPKERLVIDKAAQESANLADILKESMNEFKESFADSMKAGFVSLGAMLQNQSKEPNSRSDDSTSSSDESDDSTDSDLEITNEPPAKKTKADDETKSILQNLEENYKASDMEGPEINSSLAKIISTMIEEKSDDEKINELRKRYLQPKNCELLTETTVNLAIWNNLSEKARTSDIKLQRSQKSLIKGTTAVVKVVNDFLNESEKPSKQQIVDTLMDGVKLLTNANRELNIRRREALRPELHSSYRHLCSASNPITKELFGNDLTKAVKDITDTNKITSKTNRDNNNKYKKDRKRSRDYGNYDNNRPQRRFNHKDYPKNYQRPFYKKEGARKIGPKNQH